MSKQIALKYVQTNILNWLNKELPGREGCGWRQLTTWLSPSKNMTSSVVSLSQTKMWPQSEPLMTYLEPQNEAFLIYERIKRYLQ